MSLEILATLNGSRDESLEQSRVTFAKDVAPILFAHCASCHQPGEVAPFSVLTFRDVRPRAAAIARAVRTRAMPPWKPGPESAADFVGARHLTDAAISTIERWVELGALEGDPSELPAAPPATNGWRLGRPDLVVTMPEPFALPAGGPDVLRNFVIPVPSGGTRYVSGIEFKPGNARVVHHANIRIDRTGASRAFDRDDPAPGYDGRLSTGNFPDGHFLGWTPGQLPPLAPELAWPLEPGGDLVVQLHMKPVDSPQMIQASVGLYFTDRPARIAPLMLRLGRQNIDIAPGAASYFVEDRYVLPVDVSIVGVQPHAHYRARHVSGTARLPDGRSQRLIEIADWDFNWQDAYRYVTPIDLPKGATLSMRYSYDNSAANRRNPDRPPKRVRWGQNSTDEMGDLWIQVRTRTDEDRERLRADFAPKVITEDAIGYETLLEVEPRNVRLHEAAAAIYLSLDRIDAAVAHLRAALDRAPESIEAHYNLGIAFARQRRTDEAIEHFQRTLALDPGHAGALTNLGALLRLAGRPDEALGHLRRALELEPASAAAHTNLAGILAAREQTSEAIAHYRQALEINPRQLEALTDLSWILATDRDATLRDPREAVRLADRAVGLTARLDVRALDTLAAALASAGRFDEAVAAVEGAIALAERAGSLETVRQLRERLERYRSRRPL